MRRVLPTPGRADQRDEVAAPIGDHVVAAPRGGGQLATAPDHGVSNRRVNASASWADVDQSPRAHRLGLALERQRLDGLDRRAVPGQAVGQVADEDLAGRAAGSRRAAMLTVSPVTSVWPVAASPATTSPVLTPMRIRIERPRPARSSSLSPASAARISAAARTARSASSSWTTGYAEHGHHGIADELLDRPAVALEDAPHRREVAGHERPEGLRVEPLAHRRRARDVANTTVTTLRVSGSPAARGKPSPAFAAELGAVGFCRAQFGHDTAIGGSVGGGRGTRHVPRTAPIRSATLRPRCSLAAVDGPQAELWRRSANGQHRRAVSTPSRRMWCRRVHSCTRFTRQRPSPTYARTR